MKNIISILSIIFTLLSFRLLLKLLGSDFVISLIPSWNNTIYYDDSLLNIRTLTYGLATLIMVLFYKAFYFLLNKILNSQN